MAVTDIDRLISEKLKQARLLARMSQAQVAKQLGVTTQQVQKYENGQSRLTIGRLWQFAQAVGTSLAALIANVEACQGEDDPLAGLSPYELKLVGAFHNVDDKTKRAVFELLNALEKQHSGNDDIRDVSGFVSSARH